MNDNLDLIKTEFTKQAPLFNTYQETDVKQAFNEKAIEQMRLNGSENILEIAAGTCAFGRMIAPHVAHITELDVTAAMLAVGRQENEKANIYNVDYVIGTAEQLPFENGSFDLVVSRLAFHHFTNTDMVFNEMRRVLKSGGKIVIADMVARNEPYGHTADEYERLRDPSHVRCLTEKEFLSLADKYGFYALHKSLTDIPMDLNAWLNLTKTPQEIKDKITADMLADINGGKKTGFEPFLKNDKIMFNHKWQMLILISK